MPLSHPSILKLLDQIPQELHDLLVRTSAAVGHGAPRKMWLGMGQFFWEPPFHVFFGCSSYWEEIGLKMDLKSMIYSFTFKYEQCCESEINNSNPNSPNTRSNEIATRPWHRRAIGEVEYPNFQKQQFFDLICLDMSDMSSSLNNSHRKFMWK